VGREVSGRRDIACTISIGPFVPKAHTPFQWAGQAPVELVERRLALLKQAVVADRATQRAIRIRGAAGGPARLEGLLARGDRRVADVIEAAWRDGARFDGWREHLDLGIWEAAASRVLGAHGLAVEWYTERERPGEEILPWDHLDAGLDRDWLWQDWRDAVEDGAEVEDCRWSGCNDCGVCPRLGTRIEIGPTGGCIAAAKAA
jgi:hypothetical protein